MLLERVHRLWLRHADALLATALIVVGAYAAAAAANELDLFPAM